MLKIEKILLLFAFVLWGCTEAEMAMSEPKNEQEQILRILKSRVQIYNIKYADKKININYKNGVISIDTDFLPYIAPNDQDHWTVNGETIPSKISIRHDEVSAFPVLELSSDGFLIVNGYKTNYSWKTRMRNNHFPNEIAFWAISRIKSNLCFYCTDSSNIIIPIVESPNHIIPDYFFDQVVEKELSAESTANSVPRDCVMSYIFFTDAHWGCNQKHSPAIIKHIVDYTPINQVLFGGDVNTTRTETIQETLDIGYQFHEAFSFLGSRLYCLFGNHDDNSTGQPSLTGRHLSEEQVYSYLQSQMTDVHYWDFYNFYFDDPKSKTRFICLDTGRLYNKQFRGATLKTTQFTIECLNSVPDGWHIVAASHIWANLKDFKTGEIKESVYVRPIIEILENYNLRKKASFSYGGETIEYDFSKAGAIVEYCIGGHTHSDAVILSENGLPLINVTCDGQQEVAGNAPYMTGTINEQCVTIVVNDYTHRRVYIYHIGRGNDTIVNMWNH